MVSKISIGNRDIGGGQPCFIIAEAGVNHNGDPNLAKKMIEVAAQAGADAIKFQTFHAEDVVLKTAEKAEYQKTTTGADESQYSMIKKLELTEKNFNNLAKFAHKKKIMFLSTPFDIRSVDVLERIGVPAYKIPSGEINNYPLLSYIAQKRKPVVLSTGMATLDEVHSAITVMSERGASQIALLHCTTSYPASIDSVNLRAMETLRSAFKVPVGYSDHTKGTTIPIAAVAMGACILEKHFTLDRTLPGPDHQASLEPHELQTLVQAIRDVESAIGNGLKVPTVEEETNKCVIRRSLVAAKNISTGEIIKEEMIAVKRPGTGISPNNYLKILGSKALRPISKDELISLSDITLSKSGL